MQFKYLFASSLAAVATAGAMLPASVIAQEITASVNGNVLDENGNPLGNAEVVLTDTRTGRSASSSTNSAGGFTFRNLEVGGPYSVTATAPGFQGQTAEGVFTNLSDATSLRFELSSVTAGAENIIVVTAASVSTNPLALGPGTSFGEETLEEIPSITRDIRDVIQNDPRVVLDSSFPDEPGARGTVSCLGASTRTNSLTVDGVRQDDGFGLNDSGFPSEAQPFPFEALSQVSVEFAPFDVQYGLFSGCNINVVTKSGTNDFSGGAFVYYNDDSLSGNEINGESRNLGEFENLKFGAYLGGPIIRDRLFFHLTYDREEGKSGLTDGPAGSGAANEAAGITQDEIAQIQSIVQDVYGFDVGGVLDSRDRDTERLLARIDLNITDRHRAAFNYQRTRENFITPQNQGARFDELGLSSNFYQSGNDIDAYSLRFFSDWSDNFSTEVRLSRIDNADVQDSLGGTDFQQFEIVTPSGGSVFVGPDRFRQANDLRTQTDQAKIAGYLTAGNHTITVGAEYDSFSVFNLFIQDANGTALFDSFDDLEAGTPSEFIVRSVVSGNLADAAAEFDRDIYTFYIQDEWEVSPELTLQAGVRYDMYEGDPEPAENPLFVERYGFTNTTAYDDLDAWQPRFGFTYDFAPSDAGFTTLRGGVGVFSGGDPTVLFSNSYTNNGIVLDDVDEDDYADAMIPLVIDGFNPPAGTAALLAAGDGEVNAVDPDFVLPTVLRANLGLTHEFNSGWRVTADYIYSEAQDPLVVQALNLAQVGTGPDGRPLYRSVDFADPDCVANPGDTDNCAPRNTTDYLLTNGKGGRGHVLSGSISKAWEQGDSALAFGGDFTLGYSYSDVTEIQPLTSSRAVSNYGNFSKIDVNNPLAANANASRKHNAIMRLNLEKDFFGENTSAFTFFLKYRTGQPFSYNFDTPNDATNPFGDPTAFEDRVLLYVPLENDPTVTYADDFDLAGFNAFLAESGLDELRGEIVSRNSFESSDYWDLDLRFTQELPGFLRTGDRFKFIFDLENALNLIDSGWNTLSQRGFEYNLPIVSTQYDADANQYVFQRFQAPFGESIAVSPSIWQIQFGLRYDF